MDAPKQRVNVLTDTASPVAQTGEAFLFVLVFLIEKGMYSGYPVFTGSGGYHHVNITDKSKRATNPLKQVSVALLSVIPTQSWHKAWETGHSIPD